MPFDKSHGYEYYNIKGRGRVYVHRLVVEEHLGRVLNKSEIVHHIDGNIHNNTIENLEVLSNSEHGLIESLKRGMQLRKKEKCDGCGKELFINKDSATKLCWDCYMKFRKNRMGICKEELLNLVWTYPMTKVGKILGISDVSVKKYCIRLGVDLPPIGYWIKKERR